MNLHHHLSPLLRPEGHPHETDQTNLASSGGTISARRPFEQQWGLAVALLAPGLVGLAVEGSQGAGETGMNMQGHEGSATGVPRAPFQKGAPLIEPEVRRSVNRELRTTLRVGYAYKDIGGYRLSLRSYEGTIPGPTLRVRPGDALRIRLINDLPPNPDSAPLNMALPHHLFTRAMKTI